MNPSTQTEADRILRALRMALHEAQSLVAAGEASALLANRIALALVLTDQLSRAMGLEETDGVIEFGAGIVAASFPLGTGFCEVEGVPVSIDPEGTNARAWDIPGGRHFPLPLDAVAKPLSEEDFLRRVNALLNP
jgi:hypothetical protein